MRVFPTVVLMALLTIAMISFIGCREADFRTINEIRMVTPGEVQGQSGYLIQFNIEKQGIAPEDKVFSRAMILFRDTDITWDNFYLDITVVTERDDPRGAQILEIFRLLQQSTGLNIIDHPTNEEIPPLWVLGEGAVLVKFLRGIIIQTPTENVLLKLNLAFKESLAAMVEKALRDGPKVIDLGLPTEPPAVVAVSATSDNADSTRAEVGLIR